MYSTWIIRIYYDDSIDKEVICDVECQLDENNQLYDNVVFCNTNKMIKSFANLNDTWSAAYIHKMMWRWLPLGDSFVDVFSSRDTDSLIIEREIDSVNVWLNASKAGHIMRDHPQHGVEILGGMWGYKLHKNKSMGNKIFNLIIDRNNSVDYKKSEEKGFDQHFLRYRVYPLIRSDSVIHDSHFCFYFKDSESFPTKRKGNCFVGKPGSCNVSATNFYECPIECRPKLNQDWINC